MFLPTGNCLIGSSLDKAWSVSPLQALAIRYLELLKLLLPSIRTSVWKDLDRPAVLPKILSR